jgi:hypothetical protein
VNPSTAAAADQPDGEPDPEHAAIVIPIGPRRAQAPRADPPGGSGAWQTDGALALRIGPLPAGESRLVSQADGVPQGAARAAVVVSRALLEVLSGWRPPGQLCRWTSAQLQYDLERRAPRRPTGQRQQLLRVRLTQPSPGVAEACALTRDLVRGRVRVMAMRMELRGEQWIVTRLVAG